jgi:endonuclease/exonuclease/phosphatase family metal-dependent hydrolase
MERRSCVAPNGDLALPSRADYLRYAEMRCRVNGAPAIVALVIAVLSGTSASSSAAPRQDEQAAAPEVSTRDHLVYVELLGKGGLWGTGYEWRHRFLVAGGVAAFYELGGDRYTTLSPYLGVRPLASEHVAWFVHLGPQLVHRATPSPGPEWNGMSTTGYALEASTGVEYRWVQLTYNIDEEMADVDPAVLAAAIEDDPALAHAAVFLVQEAEQYPGEASSRIKPLAERLGLDYVYVPAHTRDRPDHTHGLGILSAYPITQVTKKDLPIAGPKQRIAVAADIVIGDRTLHIIVVHLELHASAATRIAQLRPAVIDAPAQALVAGDFNMSWVEWVPPGVPVLSSASSTDQAPVVDAYMRALGFDTPTAGSGVTAESFGFQARVDAIYPRGLDVTYGAVERVGPSDHWPMWVDVHLP